MTPDDGQGFIDGEWSGDRISMDSDMPSKSRFEKQMRNMWIAGAITVVIALLMIGYALAEFTT